MRRTGLLVALLVAAAFPAVAAGDDNPPKTTITSGPAQIVNTNTATFSFTADMSDVRFWCALDSPDFTRCTSPQAYTGVPDGTHTFVVFATKSGDREDPPVSWSWTVDTTPPTVGSPHTAVGYRRMVLSWDPSADTTRVVVLRTTRKNKPPSEEVYRGAGHHYTDNRFDNARYHGYSITGYDAAGNVSSTVEVTVSQSAMLRSPADGAQVRVKRPPVLRWRKASRARYYNVQLWRGGREVLSAWPLSTRFALKRTWTFEGRRYRLRRGRYTWFVWPSFQPFPNLAYGPLLGRASFKVS